MTTTCLLRVLKDDHEVSRGTAWLVRPQLAVTAFHVVADRERTAWRSDVEPDVEYRLGGPDGDGEVIASGGIGARPAPADPEADLALLETATPIDQAEVLTVGAEPPAVDARWRTLGYPAVSGRQPFALTGTVTEILPGAASRRLQLRADQGTDVRWGGLSGAPVTVGGRVVATVTKEMSKAATLLASPVTRLAHLLRLADAGDLIDDCRELLADVYPPAAIRDLGYLIEELGWRLPPAAWSTPAEVAERISRRAWHGGEHALRELLEEVAADVPISPRPGELIRRLHELRHDPGSAPRRPPARTELVRKLVQDLGGPLPGVALVEPFGFGARRVVDDLVEALRGRSQELVVRLVPHRQTGDERRLYGALLRDLRRGLEREIGKPLPPEWSEPLPGADATADEETFEKTVEKLVEGPVAQERRTLVLAVEGLSRLRAENLVSWAWMISRLTHELPLKVLVWGGRELHDLCKGYREIDGTSPFERLRIYEPGPWTREEVRKLAVERCGKAVDGDALYRVTGGHPALVDELLEPTQSEMGAGDEDGLRARALDSVHLRRLRWKVERHEAATHALTRMANGDLQRHRRPGEETLRWLGIVVEGGASAWQWTAPVLKDWVERWLDGN